ncbi:MAG: Asp23/Gls24 family envelope stress response protein [Clostridia bacterium]|nr:Asp23/Gls24 family envelope stress response protein [Clostridia bacterium]
MEENINLSISEEVISTMAERVILSVSGVHALNGGIMGNFLGKKGAPGIKVDISGKEIMLDVYVTVDYGTKIPDIAWEIQDRVKKELENMTGMIVTTVNVHIQGINYDKKEAKTDKEG